MDQIFSTTNLTVNQLIEKIDTGELGLPELQRPFVWKDSKVRDLFDSMIKGYPVGYLMLWDCLQIEKKKTIGTDSKNYEEPKEVIIDGQQRLTSLYAVIKGKRVVDSFYKEREIIISFNPFAGKFEVGTIATKNSRDWIYNISELFAGNSSSKFVGQFIKELETSRESNGDNFTEEERDVISENIEALFNLKQYSFPVFKIKANADEDAVSQVFVRINSEGVKLTSDNFIMTLMSVHWEEGRKKIENFCRESLFPPKSGSTSYNSIGIKIKPRDIIRTVMAYAFNRARLDYCYKLLRGADPEHKGNVSVELMQKNFEILMAKLPDVMDTANLHEFFKSLMNAGYLSDNMILSKNAIYYTYAMYLIAESRFNASYNDNLNLASLWFFHALLTSLYTGPNDTTAESHLNVIKTCNSLKDYRKFILTRVTESLTDDYFSKTLPGSDGLAVSGSGNNAWFAYVASLNIFGTKLLFSRGNLTMPSMFIPGSDGKRKALEKHHLFPKAYLKKQGYTDTQINQIANYAYIDWNDNMKILNEAPSVYYPIVCEGMSQEEIAKMEEENALPHGWENMKYEDFLAKRRKLMAGIIKRAFITLKEKAKN